MNILYISKYDPSPWRRKIEALLPEASFLVWPDDTPEDRADVDYILTWKPEPGLLATFREVKAIFNLGAGVDVLLEDKSLPKNVPIIRLVDPLLTSGMVEYVVHWVLHLHRQFQAYAKFQADHVWKENPPPFTAKRAIGFLGFGELGQAAAVALQGLGFKNIAGWSRSKKEVPGCESFAGNDELAAFLGRTEILVTLLPLTPNTHHILNRETLAQLPKGACIINPGRGALIDDDAALAALNDGHLKTAVLDAFEVEPLDPAHAYWDHRDVVVTPHIASLTVAGSAAASTARSIGRIEAGEPPENVVDLDQGY